MPDWVIDVNVLIAANGRDTHASLPCQRACIEKLRQAQEQIVLLDHQQKRGSQILTEYLRYCRPQGQPGVGDAFFKWLWYNQANPTHCRKMQVLPHPQRGYEEFPDDPALEHFDPADRVYVAVAIKALQEELLPVILNALDRDWLEYQDALSKYRVLVDQICLSDISSSPTREQT